MRVFYCNDTISKIDTWHRAWRVERNGNQKVKTSEFKSDWKENKTELFGWILVCTVSMPGEFLFSRLSVAPQ